MPNSWVYKWNNRGNYGHGYRNNDWADVFADLGQAEEVRGGSTGRISDLSRLQRGDQILAYQTDRNELVGIARVVALRRRGNSHDVYLRPVRRIGVRVRPLKANRQVARIPAFQGGRIRTLYPISKADVATLLRAATAQLRTETEESALEVPRALAGAGFGTPEQNKKVEQAAVTRVKRWFQATGWSVRDVSRDKTRGYDLVCKRAGRERHVEVKGASGDGRQFLITAQEFRTWSTDRRFTLAFVRHALSREAAPTFYDGPQARTEFAFRELCYVAIPRSPRPV